MTCADFIVLRGFERDRVAKTTTFHSMLVVLLFKLLYLLGYLGLIARLLAFLDDIAWCAVIIRKKRAFGPGSRPFGPP